MAKTAGPKKESRKNSLRPREALLLPLPQTVLSHHLPVLLPRMRQWLKQKRFPPVLLLSGASGLGKRQIAYFISQWLLCQKAEIENDGPCSECPPCRRALQNHWVDFTEITTESEAEGSSTSSSTTGAVSATLKIEQFRHLKATLGFGAFESKFKIILIRDAERMTPQAANSVLKILEEPPAGWIFFLTTQDPSLLLPTIVSRCQILRLSPFSTEELLKLLEEAQVPPTRRSMCATLAQGSWMRALELADDATWEGRAILFKFFENPHTELNTLLDWTSQEPHRFELLLDQVEQIIADLLKTTLLSTPPSDPPSEKTDWLNLDGKKSLLIHAQKIYKKFQNSSGLARTFWLKQAENLLQARHRLKAPLNRKLLIQDVMLPWLEIHTSP